MDPSPSAASAPGGDTLNDRISRCRCPAIDPRTPTGFCVLFWSIVAAIAFFFYWLTWKPDGFPWPLDARPSGCWYQESPPDVEVSMIFPYRGASLDHMIGTMKSILYFTPNHHIREILMVSDGNPPEAVHEKKLKKLSRKIRVIQLPKSLGPAGARAAGAKEATAEILLFLEPHIVVNYEWIEPLINRIIHDHNVIAIPVVDIIQDHYKNFSKAKYLLRNAWGHWRFEWNFNLINTEPVEFPKTVDPYPTPAVKGIFAIHRELWDRLGFYDTGLIGYGADEVEVSLKTWLCGSRIEVVPCSRIAELVIWARERPYPVDPEQVARNYARAAHIYLEDGAQRDTFFKVRPEAKDQSPGDISAQKKLLADLRCENMSWYLENVDAELQWEQKRACIPSCKKWKENPDCCKDGKQAAPGRTTIMKAMSGKEYRKRSKFVIPVTEDPRSEL
eukprot:gnl/MRDRNA2_/MRDRNA2_34096_c0_seq1.p1 gnl/MRDRNA2_/MRDRNA2_34096_c0~~gnl/MRDRNA2_/MRDRNA2_34096_c0_seq1.p1  ORF type:complete len:446 (+),score=59.01 gnl/MRDRNA2_/MRDRNA2_34096_c0_seq1:49-1386(+)